MSWVNIRLTGDFKFLDQISTKLKTELFSGQRTSIGKRSDDLIPHFVII